MKCMTKFQINGRGASIPNSSLISNFTPTPRVVDDENNSLPFMNGLPVGNPNNKVISTPQVSLPGYLSNQVPWNYSPSGMALGMQNNSFSTSEDEHQSNDWGYVQANSQPQLPPQQPLYNREVIHHEDLDLNETIPTPSDQIDHISIHDLDDGDYSVFYQEEIIASGSKSEMKSFLDNFIQQDGLELNLLSVTKKLPFGVGTFIDD